MGQSWWFHITVKVLSHIKRSINFRLIWKRLANPIHWCVVSSFFFYNMNQGKTFLKFCFLSFLTYEQVILFLPSVPLATSSILVTRILTRCLKAIALGPRQWKNKSLNSLSKSTWSKNPRFFGLVRCPLTINAYCMISRSLFLISLFRLLWFACPSWADSSTWSWRVICASQYCQRRYQLGYELLVSSAVCCWSAQGPTHYRLWYVSFFHFQKLGVTELLSLPGYLYHVAGSMANDEMDYRSLQLWWCCCCFWSWSIWFDR